MTPLTRKDLIKIIVAHEMIDKQNPEAYNRHLKETYKIWEQNPEAYNRHLKETYKIWEHKSSEELVSKYNQIRHGHLTVDLLSTNA